MNYREIFDRDSATRTIFAWNDMQPSLRISCVAIDQIMEGQNKIVPKSEVRARILVGYLLQGIHHFGEKSVKEHPEIYENALHKANTMKVYGEPETLEFIETHQFLGVNANNLSVLSLVEPVVMKPEKNTNGKKL